MFENKTKVVLRARNAHDPVCGFLNAEALDLTRFQVPELEVIAGF